MRRIDLREHKQSEDPHPLSATERHQLREALPSVVHVPAEKDGEYYLKPGSVVGALEVGDLSVRIAPKIGIPQLVSLACYAVGIVKHQHLKMFDFQKDQALPDVLATALWSAARQAFRKGLLHGYHTEEEAIYGIRGRIRFDDQLRTRFTIAMPVEVRYDEFTNDILANQLVKAASVRLGRMPLRSRQARQGMGWIGGILADVSWTEFQPRSVPEVAFDRLNEHYRLVVELARLILRHSEYQSVRGRVRSSGFLVDMNILFEEFVMRALREALEVSERTFRKVRHGDGVTLDEHRLVRLEPDLSWWEGRTCRFVGDAKYKNIDGKKGPPVSDLYQLLAYTTVLDLPGGMLIYAKGEADPAVHQVRHLGKLLEVVALDLSGTLDQILARVEELTKRIKALRNKALALRPAA